jgi:hypothetical protein
MSIRMIERRRAQRELILRVATVIANGRSSGIACKIRNWSANGACLQVAQGLRVPSCYELALAGSNNNLLADVVWRTGNRVGVAFRFSPASPSSSPRAA